MGLPRHWKILGGHLSVGIPIAYMIGTHITWEGDFNSKMRMALKHAGFWGGLWLTVASFHNFAFPKSKFRQALPVFLGASLFPILGYEGMRRLAPLWFPQESIKSLPVVKPKPANRQWISPLPSSQVISAVPQVPQSTPIYVSYPDAPGPIIPYPTWQPPLYPMPL